MSTYSQPVHTISNCQNSVSNSSIYQPQYANISQDQKMNSTIDYQSNKLPLNLFYSAAEYNKMLITNGKNKKKKNNQIIDGIITSLDYVNDHIFQKQIEKKNKARAFINQSNKPSQKQKQNCICCCCKDYCNQCNKKIHISQKNLSNSQIIKIKKTIDNQIKVARQSNLSNTIAYCNKKNSKVTNYKKYISQKSNKSQSKRTNSAFEIQKSNSQNQYLKNKISIKNTQSKATDISHLIIKSMMKFNEKKKIQKLNQISNLQNKQQKQQYLEQLNNRIRMHNLQFSRISKSKRTQKSMTKHQAALKYWQNVREKVIDSLKNDNYSKSLKKSLNNYKINIYQHHQAQKRKIQLTQQQINFLRLKHQQQAKFIIQNQIRQKLQNVKKVEIGLKKLEKQRKNKIRSCEKKPFRPTADMIQNAFKNLVQQDNNANHIQIFKNQRFKKSQNQNRKRS